MEERVDRPWRPERRRYRRIYKHFLTRLRVKPGQERKCALTGWDIITLQDFGAGGVLFNFNGEIEAGTVMEFKINFPLSRLPVNCLGRVVRVKAVPNSHLFRIAVVFTEIDEQEKEMINKSAEEKICHR